MSEHHFPAPPAAHHGSFDVSAAVDKLKAFVERLKAIPPAPRHLGDGQVEVVPGGKTFPTIAAALNSITDASHQKEYTIYIGPGVYAESVVCKPWVFIEGSGPDVTTIRARGGVTGASDSSIGSVTIDAGPTAIACTGAVNFAVGNCNVISSDGAQHQPNNYLGISVDFSGKAASPSSVSIGYSTIVASTSDTLSITAAVVAAANAVVLLNYCPKVTAQGGSTNMGCAAGTAAEIRLYDCSISSPVWGLRLLDTTASMTATACTIKGDVSPGVVINN
jgi:hypothetical protein